MRLVVVNNIPTPYIVPVFNALGDQVGPSFHGVFLARTESNRQWTDTVSGLRCAHTILASRGMFIRKGDTGIHVHWGLWRLLRTLKPDVVCICGYQYFASWEVLLFGRIYGCRTVLWSGSHLKSGLLPSRPASAYKRLIIPKFDAYVTYGQAARELLVQHGAEPSRIVVGCNTVDVDWFARTAREIRAESGTADVNASGLVVLYVGEFLPRKNVDVLLRAFALIERQIPNARLRLVGTGSRTAAALKLARLNGVINIECVPFVERRELVRQYTQAAVFVLPSLREVWGLVVNEAMACGVPVLVSNTAGAAHDLVQEDVNGRTFDPLDVEGLAVAIRDLLADPDRRAKMGMAARTRALECTPAFAAARIAEAAALALGSEG